MRPFAACPRGRAVYLAALAGERAHPRGAGLCGQVSASSTPVAVPVMGVWVLLAKGSRAGVTMGSQGLLACIKSCARVERTL